MEYDHAGSLFPSPVKTGVAMTVDLDHGQRADVGALLGEASAASLLATGAPFVVAGAGPEALYANDAALILFGAGDLTALTARLFESRDPGSKRLAELSTMMAPGAPPRLERLRFFVQRQSELLTLQCRRTAGAESLLVIAALGVRPALLRGPLPARRVETVAPRRDEAPPQAEAVPEPIAEAPAPVVMPEPAQAQQSRVDVEAVRADLQKRFDGARSVRFLWQTDADLVFVSITGALCEVVGCAMSDLVGHAFADVAIHLGLDVNGSLAAALARRETWSGVEIVWPISGADATVPVTLGALPAFDRGRHFEGFRGFGVIHVQRVAAAPQPPEAEPAQLETETPEPSEAAAGEALEEAAPSPGTEPVSPIAPISVDPVAGDIASVAPIEEPPLEAAAPDSETARSRGENVVPLRAYQALARPGSAPTPRLVDPAAPAGATEALAERLEPGGATSARSLTERLSEVILTPHVREGTELSNSEQMAFREIARALGARIVEATPPASTTSGPEPQPPSDAVAPPDAPESTQWPATEVSAPPTTAAEVAPETIDAEALLDRLAVGILVSRDGEPLYANRALLDRLGYGTTEAFVSAGAARSLLSRASAETRSATETAAFGLRAASGDLVTLEGQSHRAQWRGAPAFLTTLSPPPPPDLSGRVNVLEQEIRQRDSETRELHTILDTATDGVVVLDENGLILSLNRAGQALFGFDQSEVVGEPFTLLLAKESHTAAMDYLDGLKANGVASVLNDGREALGRARQGGAIPLFMTMGRVGAAQNAKFCAVLRDITAWKKAERELSDARRQAERASALKSDFLAKISHEIRTPLNAILGFAEVIMEERFGPVGNDRYKDYLKDIHSSGTHVMSLVNDLLDLSKIEAGKLDLNFGAVDANKVVSECVSLIQPQANQERVIVRLSIAPQLPHIVADERSLRQIVLNILSNAVKFNVPGGQVIVSTALTDAGHAVIRVRDTGIGMSETDVETALEPFRQIATSHNTTGTGLGLPLTKALVEANRASFTIKSKRKEGTLVEVAFPSTRVLAE